MEKNNVNFGKPKVGGAIFIAPLNGTTAPTMPKSAKEELGTMFKSAGYVEDGGIKSTIKKDVDIKYAWGGTAIGANNKKTEVTMQIPLIESRNEDVLKFVFGDSNVKTDENGIAVDINGNDETEWMVVIDMATRGGKVHRIVIPDCIITSLGDISYKDDDIVKYETTVTALAYDNNNNYQKEYWEK